MDSNVLKPTFTHTDIHTQIHKECVWNSMTNAPNFQSNEVLWAVTSNVTVKASLWEDIHRF